MNKGTIAESTLHDYKEVEVKVDILRIHKLLQGNTLFIKAKCKRKLYRTHIVFLKGNNEFAIYIEKSYRNTDNSTKDYGTYLLECILMGKEETEEKIMKNIDKKEFIENNDFYIITYRKR